MISISSYLHKSRHNIFYFRVVAPQAAGKHAGREIRISLKTKELPVATRYSAILKRESEVFFRWLSVNEISWEELKTILNKTLTKSIEHFSRELLSKGPKPKYTEEIWELNQIPNWQKNILDIEALEFDVLKNAETTVVNIPESVQLIANRFLQQNDIVLDIESPLYLKFCKAALEMNIALTEEALKRNNEAKQFQFSSISNNPSVYSQLPPQTKQNTELFSNAVEMFVEDKLKGKKWKKKTEDQNRKAFELLKELLGDFDMNNVSSQDALRFKKVLLKLPSNRKKKPQYKNMSLDDFLNSDIPDIDKLSTSKINANIGNVSSLFSWAVKHGLCSINPFSGISISENIANIDKSQPFSDANIKEIFSTELFTNSKFLHPHYFWLPMLALYTGARINELCQLYLSDIKLDSGVWVFDFNEEHEKTLKYPWCKRMTPVHGSLIKSGLINYKSFLEEKGETRLFPILKMSEKTTYGHAPSKWFNDRYLKKIGIKHKEITFHSFRHTVIDNLKQKHIEVAIIKAITGHKDESITTGVYGSSYTPNSLKPIIDGLDFDVLSYPFIYKNENFSNV